MAQKPIQHPLGMVLVPQSVDPSNPVEGQLQRADGTARAIGLWEYKSAAWAQLGSTTPTLTVATKTTNYTLLSTDDVIFGDTTSGDVTLSLPAASTVTGKIYYIKRITVADGNEVIIDPDSSETVLGLATLSLFSKEELVAIISDGANWQVIEDQLDVSAELFVDANQTVTNGTTAEVAVFDGVSTDARSLWSTSTDSAVIVVPGVYEIQVDFRFGFVGTINSGELNLLVDSTIVKTSRIAAASSQTNHVLFYRARLAAAAEIEFTIDNNSTGGNLLLNGDASGVISTLNIKRIGS